jgi:two-component system cell cycle response regulator
MSVFDIKNLPEKPNNEMDKPLIMLVDDEVENINVLRQLLEAHFQIITGLNGAEAIELINNMVDPTKIQLIITDQCMPIVTGVEFLEQIVDRMPDTIRIILTGYSDTQVIIDAINKAKLYKFLTKPFDPVELSMTVKRGVEAYQMRQALVNYATNLEQLVEERTVELNEKNKALNQALISLEQLSLSDQLTGAHNRHFLMKHMPQELEKFKREHASDKSKNIGLIMVDIDFFKKVNDTYGHDAGDKVLIEFTQILTRTCRASDWIVRWGGEEFVIITRGHTIDDLEQLAERIRNNVELFSFDLGGNQTINCTCSIGITCFPFLQNHLEALTWEQTLNFSDLALYLAKNNGRNTWVSLIENINNENTQLIVNDSNKFYNNVMKNLVNHIETKQVLYHTPIIDKQLKF